MILHKIYSLEDIALIVSGDFLAAPAAVVSPGVSVVLAIELKLVASSAATLVEAPPKN